jgi:hypothetical protein
MEYPDLLTPTECSNIIHILQTLQTEFTSIYTFQNPELSTLLKDRLEIKMPYYISTAWTGMIYKPGDSLGPHIDGHRKEKNGRSEYSILVYLNDDFLDGYTYIKDRYIIPKMGKVVIFDQDTMHEGCRVNDGIKYIMRGDIMKSCE